MKKRTHGRARSWAVKRTRRAARGRNHGSLCGVVTARLTRISPGIEINVITIAQNVELERRTQKRWL